MIKDDIAWGVIINLLVYLYVSINLKNVTYGIYQSMFRLTLYHPIDISKYLYMVALLQYAPAFGKSGHSCSEF